MASNKEISLKVSIDSANAASNLKELNKALKDLISQQSNVAAGSESFKKLSQAINDTEGKIGDLQDSFGTLRGSGVEKLNSSLNLLKDGFLSADPGKFKIALDGLKGAMSAIPIFLVIEGFKLLVDNFSTVTEVLGITTHIVNEHKQAQEALEIQLKKSREETDRLVKSINDEITIHKLLNKPLQDRIDLEKKKTKVIVGSIDEQIKKQEELISSTKDQIEKEKESLVTSQLSAAGTLTNYNNIVEGQKLQLEAKLETQNNELESLKQFKLDEAKAEAEGKAAIEALNEEASKSYKELEQNKFKAAEEYAKDMANFRKDQEQKEWTQRQLLLDQEALYLSELKKQRIADQEESDKQDKVISLNFKSSQMEAIKSRISLAENGSKEELKLLKELNNLARAEEIGATEDSQYKINQINEKYINLNKKLDEDYIKNKLKDLQMIANTFNQLGSIISSFGNIQKAADDEKLKQLQSQNSMENFYLQESTNNQKRAIDEQLSNENLSISERNRLQKEKEQIEADYQNNLYTLLLAGFNETEELKKKQFENDKKSKIASTIISTIAAAIGAITGAFQTYKDPITAGLVGGISAAAVTVAGALSVAQIAKTKYIGGTPPSKPNISISGASGGDEKSSSSQNIPTFGINSGGASTFNGSNVPGQSERMMSMKVYVTQTDIEEQNKKVQVIQDRATY